MISRGGRGSIILEKYEDHYIKSHKKCEDGGGGWKFSKKVWEHSRMAPFINPFIVALTLGIHNRPK